MINSPYTREQISQALFTLLKGVTAWKYTSRQVKLWGDTPMEQRPSMMLGEHGEDYVQDDEGVPPLITLDYSVYVYTNARTAVPPIYPVTLLNNAFDAIDQALKPDPSTGKLTLGGMVSHCWQEGRRIKEPGDLDGDGVLIIPIKVLVPS